MSEFTLFWKGMHKSSHNSSGILPRASEEDEQKLFVLDSSISTSLKLSAAFLLNPPNHLDICLAGPIISVERSSTKQDGETVGWVYMAFRMMRIITSFLSRRAASRRDTSVCLHFLGHYLPHSDRSRHLVGLKRKPNAPELVAKSNRFPHDQPVRYAVKRFR